MRWKASPRGRRSRAFNALLSLYPAAFRDEYRRELSLVFADRYRDAANSRDRTLLWFEAIAGILQEAPKEHCRMIVNDLEDAWRSLRHHAFVTAVVVFTLGLGIGANTAVFSAINAIALRSPLPVDDAGELYVVNSGRYVASGPEAARLSGPMFDAVREAAPAGVDVAAMSRGIARGYARTAAEHEAIPASLQLVSPNFFPVFRVTPALGRLTLETGDGAGSSQLAVLSHAYWQRRFGGSPQAVGSAIVVNGVSFTIAGVAASGFGGVWLETPVDIWLPLTAQPLIQYSQSFSADGADLRRPWLPQAGIWWLHVVARVPQAQKPAAAAAFNGSLSRLVNRDANVQLQPLARGFSRIRQQFATPLVALLVMAALVLLTACASVANLLLARAVVRQRELAVRLALGAGRARLFQQLLVESALIVFLAAIAAVLFARWGGDVLLRIAAAETPGVATAVDVRVLAFAAAAALVSVVVFGVWPAWRATRVDPVDAFRGSSRTITAGAARASRGLVVFQAALSLLLVAGTGLFVRSFEKLLHVDVGVEPARLLLVGIDPRLAGAPPGELAAMYRHILDDVASVPGVESASLAMCGLQGQCSLEDGLSVEGYQPRPEEIIAFSVNIVTPEYLPTVGLPLLGGRSLQAADATNVSRVAVVNRTLAAKYFGGDWRRAIGRRFGAGSPDVEIVGVVEDSRGLGSLRVAAIPSVFMPFGSGGVVPRELQVRTSTDPAAMVGSIRRALAAAAPGLPIESLEPAAVRVDRSLGQERLMMLLTSAFAALALGLAALGLFSVQSYAVARRAPEIGLRIALGAAPSSVLLAVVKDALRLVACGTLLGLPLVALGGRLASGLVFGISPYDPLTLTAAVAVLIAVGVAASAGPARRAARVDPMVALRQE